MSEEAEFMCRNFLEKPKLKDMLKCSVCGKPYKKISEYEYIGDCEHVPKKIIISVG